MAEETLYRDEFWTVTHDPAQAFFRVVRSSVPFEDLARVTETFHELQRVVRERGAAGGRLLIDSRAAIGRNDADFERITARFRNEVLAGFAKTALLVKSAVGRMQVERMSREHGGPRSEVFTDEAEAYRALGVTR